MVRRVAIAMVVVVVVAAMSSDRAAAQDSGLDPLLFAPSPEQAEEAAEVQAHTVQLYRLPLGFRLRSADDRDWGLRLTFPVSISALSLQRVSDLGRVATHLAIVSVVPGLEFDIPVGERLRLRPFGEAGFGRSTDTGQSEVLYGIGLRARLDARAGPVYLTCGGSAMRRKLGGGDDEYGAHSTFEGAIDTEVPLGFSVARQPARGGVYVVGRRYLGLSLERTGQVPVTLEHQFEVGGSFTSGAGIPIWKIRLPWLAVGYQFGQELSGVRFYVAFPF